MQKVQNEGNYNIKIANEELLEHNNQINYTDTFKNAILGHNTQLEGKQVSHYQYLDEPLSDYQRDNIHNIIELEEYVDIPKQLEGEEISIKQLQDPNYQYWYEGQITWEQQQLNMSENSNYQARIKPSQVLIQEISYEEECPRTKIKPNRVYPTFPTFKSKVRDQKGVYREICNVCRIQSGGKRVKVKLRSPHTCYRWISRDKVPPILIKYYHQDKRQRRNQKVTPTILAVFQSQTKIDQTIDKVLSHFFLEEKLYFRVRFTDGTDKILERQAVITNSPKSLIQYYSDLDDKIKSFQEQN